MENNGKITVITGANGGVGLATSKQLARQGDFVVMVCRNEIRGTIARDEVADIATGSPPTLFIADLSSQISIRKLALELHERLARIDVLINNAGAIFAKRELTTDGIEKTFATNHLAPFLLTNLVLDLLIAAPSGRILSVASESHNGTLDFENLEGEIRYNFFDAYNRSKLCNILFAYELSRKLKHTGVTSNCLSPGPTVTTFGDNMKGLPGLFPSLMKRIPFLFGSPEKAAITYVHLASSVDVEHITGKFFLKGRERKTRSITYDDKVAAKLWTVSEKLTNTRNGQPKFSQGNVEMIS
jgi:retinol dehydrogenase-12